jgi:hypothetical protein
MQVKHCRDGMNNNLDLATSYILIIFLYYEESYSLLEEYLAIYFMKNTHKGVMNENAKKVLSDGCGRIM